MKLYGFKPLKPPKNFDLKSSSAKKFIQIIILSLRVLLESSFKVFKNFKNSKQSKLHRIQALKSWRTYTTNLIKSRTFEEYTKNVKNLKNKKSLTSSYQIFIAISFRISFNPLSNQSEDNLCSNQDHIDAILELKTFPRILNQRIILLYYNLTTENCTYKFINTNLHLWNIADCLIFKLEILCLQTQRKVFDGGMFKVA